METNEKRIVVLRRIIGDMQLKDFANRFDIDPSYLSQILNGHRNLGERAARNMEAKIDLVPGTLENPVLDSVESLGVADNVAASVERKADQLSAIATPRSREILLKIVNAAAQGRLSDADIELLDKIASRFESGTYESSALTSTAGHKRLRERLAKDDPLSKA
jgi:transcriptional regulator with XRE-family HTH domain